MYTLNATGMDCVHCSPVLLLRWTVSTIPQTKLEKQSLIDFIIVNLLAMFTLRETLPTDSFARDVCFKVAGLRGKGYPCCHTGTGFFALMYNHVAAFI